MLSNLGERLRHGVRLLHDHLPHRRWAGLFSERSGIVNIGLEGMMIMGTVTGAYGALFTQLGTARRASRSDCCAGALFASIHAVATVTFRVDQIVSGVVINLAAVGIARFLSQRLVRPGDAVRPGRQRTWASGTSRCCPKIPWGLGRAFQNMSPMVIVAFLMVFPVSFVLYRTRFGLRLRSAGENPEATRRSASGSRRSATPAVLLSGAFAGTAGGSSRSR